MKLRDHARATVLMLLLAAPATRLHATVLDPNVTESLWITVAPGGVTGMAWAPDGSGRLFVTFQTGAVRVVQYGTPPTLLPTPFATLSPIYTNSECGLIGITFDPAFVSNHFVYFFVTVSSGEQQIIRYTDASSIGVDKTSIIKNLPTQGQNHDGGGIGFGSDGKLYWSIGDNGNGTGVNGDLTSLASKIGRAWVEGTVPLDNPFRDGPGPNNDYIWARGLRNPFTMNFQPSTGRLWVDVTGGNYEQVFAPLSGEHMGWNTYENNQPAGFITPLIKYRTNSTDVAGIVAGGAVRSGNTATFTTASVHGFRVGEKITVAGVSNATFNGAVYVSSTPTSMSFTAAQSGADAVSGGGTATTQALGGALTGGAFYDGTGFPSGYRGNYFFGDYNSGNVMRVVVKTDTIISSVDVWATGSNSIDVAPGSDGAVYILKANGQIYREAYIATAQALVVSDTHLFIREGQPVAFTVRLATPPGSPVAVAVARTGGSTDVSVQSGAALTFTPANYSVPQTVRLFEADDVDVLDESSTFTVSSTGLVSEAVVANVIDLSGAAGGASGPGAVPDGATVPGVPLTVAKSATPGSLNLAWGASCGAGATDYGIQEGTIGAWYSHTAKQCSTTGARSATIIPGTGNRYYLVVPLGDQSEGSYGKASSGLERPRPGEACRTVRDTTSCP